MLTIRTESLQSLTVLVVRGRFDGSGSVSFDSAVAPLLDQPKAQALLDLSGVDYLSSAGLRSLLRLAKARWRYRERVFLIAPQASVLNVLEMAGLLDQFEIAPDRATASRTAGEQSVFKSRRVEVSLASRKCTITPLSGQGRLEHWSVASGNAPLCLSLAELGLAVGSAGLGNTSAQASEGTGSFLSTGRAICVRSLQTPDAPPDFMVTAQPAELPVYVLNMWRLAGSPSVFASSDEGDSTLEEVLGSLPGLLNNATGKSSGGCGWVLAARNSGADGDAGRICIGFTAPTGEGCAETVSVSGLSLNADPGSVDAFLQKMLTDETLSPAIGPNGRVGAWIAWLYQVSRVSSAIEGRLDVVFEGEAAPPEEWDWIARRLYPEAGQVTLRRLCGGFSAATFHVESRDREGRRLLPTVLKLADPAFSAREDRAYDLYVRTYILNNSAVRMGRCARNEWVGLRYNFLGITGAESRLSWIGDHLTRRPIQETLPLFETLFEKILAPWHGQARPAAIAPYREHDPRALFPALVKEAQNVLGVSADQPFMPCPLLGCELPNPYFLLERVYPARVGAEWPGMTAISHGDLNLNNVLLDEKENMFVIDFSETHVGDLSGDFSRLEPLVLLQMTRMEKESDLAALLAYLRKTVAPDCLFDPPDVYTGDDPFMAKAHPLVRLLRREAMKLSAGRLHPAPYLLGLLRWSLPIVVFRQLPLLNKQASCFASAVLSEALLVADPAAAKLLQSA